MTGRSNTPRNEELAARLCQLARAEGILAIHGLQAALLDAASALVSTPQSRADGAGTVTGTPLPVAYLYEADGFADAFSKTRLKGEWMMGNPKETPLYSSPVSSIQATTEDTRADLPKCDRTTARRDDFEEWMDGFWPGWALQCGNAELAKLRTCWNAAKLAVLRTSPSSATKESGNG